MQRDPRIDPLHPITLDPSQRTWSLKHVVLVLAILIIGFILFAIIIDLLF